ANWNILGVDPYRLVRCSSCGLIYLNPRPDADEIGKYYEEMYPCYKHSIESESNSLIRWVRRGNLAARRKHVERASQKKTGKILDVGCATGLFLNEMQLAGWKSYG